MTDRNTRYEALVIEIAAEALPRQSVLATSDAWDASAEHGPNSWTVRITYTAARQAEDQSN